MKFLTILAALPCALGAQLLSLPEGAQIISNKYIVVMRQDSAPNALDNVLAQVTNMGAETGHVFEVDSFRGFAMGATQALLTSILDIQDIDYIEPDTVVKVNAVQSNAPWGLARISHKNKGAKTYPYNDAAGVGSTVYGIDTGIFTEHPDFGGRASQGANFADNMPGDGNGHGTHTAGTMASTTYGVAKKAQIIAVKVLGADGSGANSNVVMGIAWAANDAASKGKANKSVGNLSLGGPALVSTASGDAVRAGIKKGMFYSIAAGNDGAPASSSSPANVQEACTVGATDKNDAIASFSNTGRLVDVLAPGVDIISTWNDGKTMTISGTSMAAPHVGGLAAYFASTVGPKTPQAMCAYISRVSNKGKISGFNPVTQLVDPTANNLAYNNNGQ